MVETERKRKYQYASHLWLIAAEEETSRDIFFNSWSNTVFALWRQTSEINAFIIGDFSLLLIREINITTVCINSVKKKKNAVDVKDDTKTKGSHKKYYSNNKGIQ